MESQAADGSNSLSHKTIVVFDIVDQLPVSVVDCSELIHWATGRESREHGVTENAVVRTILLPTAPFPAVSTWAVHQTSAQWVLVSGETDFNCTAATSVQKIYRKAGTTVTCYTETKNHEELMHTHTLKVDPPTTPGYVAGGAVAGPHSEPKNTHADFEQGSDIGV